VATRPTIFKWRRTEPAVILCAVRWYLRYSLSLRDVEELLLERGLAADHTTVWRWVQRYGPELELRIRRHLKATNKSWRVDETYLKVKGRWCYLYRAIDSAGATIDFRRRCRHRPVQYLNNIIEQDHRAIKRRVNAKQGFTEFQAARRTTQGYEVIHMMRKGQVRWVSGADIRRQNQFINNVFELTA
jgi:IS6 family transposase